MSIVMHTGSAWVKRKSVNAILLNDCQLIISSRWNYKVLADIFVKIELFTNSYSVTTYLHYVMCIFLSCVHCGSFY